MGELQMISTARAKLLCLLEKCMTEVIDLSRQIHSNIGGDEGPAVWEKLAQTSHQTRRLKR
jgi:hypothetical protein